MSIQNTDANYCKLDVVDIPNNTWGSVYIPVFELGKCTVTVQGGNELKSNCYCLIPNDSDELKGTNFDPSMIDSPPDDILDCMEITMNKVEVENSNINDGEFSCSMYYFGFDGNLDSSIADQTILSNFYGLFYINFGTFEGQRQGLISFTFSPIRFNLYYYDEYGNPQETYFDYTPKLYIDLNINTLDPVMVVTRSYPDYIDIEKSNTERDFNLYIDFTVSYENDVNNTGTSKIVDINNKQILGSIDFTFKGTGKVDNLNPILNTQGITQCTMSIDWDNTDMNKIRCNFIGKYLNDGGTYSVQTILGSVFISDIEDGTYDTGNIYLVFMLK